MLHLGSWDFFRFALISSNLVCDDDDDDGHGGFGVMVMLMTMGWLSDLIAAPASDSDTPGTLGPETQVSLDRPNHRRLTLCCLSGRLDGRLIRSCRSSPTILVNP
jgi:hypothetical protein